MIKYLAFLTLMLFASLANSQTLHLVTAVDIEDIEFGTTSLGDESLMLEMCEIATGHLKYKLKTTFLNKENFNASAIRDALENLPSKKKDIIIFYYSGKGYYPDNNSSIYPFFGLKNTINNPISLDEVAEIINSKKEALGMVIADCRDTKPTGRPMLPGFEFSGDWLDKLMTQKLFLGTCGIVKICSSSKGQPTYTSKYGESSAFTKGLTSNFKNILNYARLETADRVNLEFWINNSFLAARSEGGTEEQNGNLSILSCDESRKQIAMQFPSYANALPYRNLERMHSDLVYEESIQKRKDLISKLKKGFHKNAKISIKQFKEGEEIAFSQRKINSETYWKELAEFNPNLISTTIPSNLVKRTKDFSKITFLEVQEMLK